MREVLISIQPKWASPITLGKKTVECRKNKPNCEVPFKCYIYCSAKDYEEVFGVDKFMHKVFLNGKGKGKVIGEFVCDKIYNIPFLIPFDSDDVWHPMFYGFTSMACLADYEIDNYLGKKDGYGWHITDLIVYDEARELSEFKHECNGICIDTKKKIKCDRFDEKIHKYDFSCDRLKPITRPPMSWQFCVATEPRQTAD